MNEHQAQAALDEVAEYLSKPRTKEEIDRSCAIIDEIYQKHIDYLTELIEEVSSDYVPMEQ